MGAKRSCFISLSLFAVISSLTVGCGGSGGSSSDTGAASGEPSPSATPSPLQAALNGIRDDGTWSTETALAAFSAAFGPMPGVDQPQPDTSWHSGTLAMRMVEAVWDDLTDAQRQTVRDYAGPAASSFLPGDGGPQTGVSPRSDTLVLSIADDIPPGVPRSRPDSADSYQQMLDQAAADITSHLGRSLGIPFRVVLTDKEDSGGAWAWANGNWAEVPDGSPASACIVTIPPSTNNSSRAPYLRWLFLHEVWHCFQYTMVGHATLLANPAWVTEGEASWVAEAITGGSGAPPPEAEHWGHYINDPGKPIYSRAYDAVGFYAQLAHNNIDPWKILDNMVAAGGSDAAFQASGATAATFADRWGASWFRDAKPSNDWAMSDGYGILPPSIRPIPQSIDLADSADGTISAVPNSGSIADVHTTAFVTHIEVSGVGRIADEGGGLDKIIRAGSLDLCTSASGDCKCPEGSPNSDSPPDKAPSRFRAAVTGEQHNSSQMNLRGIAQDEWCGRTPKPTPSPTAPPGTGGADCETLLPSSDVQQAVGVDLGEPTNLGELSVLSVACVWESARWSLQANSKGNPFPPKESQLAGQICARKGSQTNIVYCLSTAQGNGQSAAGGFILTSRWAFILTTANISIDQVESGIIPILARTGN